MVIIRLIRRGLSSASPSPAKGKGTEFAARLTKKNQTAPHLPSWSPRSWQDETYSQVAVSAWSMARSSSAKIDRALAEDGERWRLRFGRRTNWMISALMQISPLLWNRDYVCCVTSADSWIKKRGMTAQPCAGHFGREPCSLLESRVPARSRAPAKGKSRPPSRRRFAHPLGTRSSNAYSLMGEKPRDLRRVSNHEASRDQAGFGRQRA